VFRPSGLVEVDPLRRILFSRGDFRSEVQKPSCFYPLGLMCGRAGIFSLLLAALEPGCIDRGSVFFENPVIGVRLWFFTPPFFTPYVQSFPTECFPRTT